MADMCRICGSKYPSSKWRRRLFGGDKTLATTLGGILGREVSESDQLPSTICSPCQNKLFKVVRLENELKTVKDWIISTFARYVDSCASRGRWFYAHSRKTQNSTQFTRITRILPALQSPVQVLQSTTTPPQKNQLVPE